MPIGAEHEQGTRLALTGLMVNVALATAKLVAGILGHSYALIADAVESMTDIAGSLVIWRGLNIASRPADEEHPYGHGKAEAISSMLVAAMVGAAGVGVGVKAVHELLGPGQRPAWYTLVVLVVVVLVKETMFQVVRRAAKRSGSGAVHTDAWHHRADAITSLFALMGISIALYDERYVHADAWAALLASFIILYNAWILIVPPVRELMDEVPAAAVEEARRVAGTVPGVRAIEKTFGRKIGTEYWIDMHVQVDPAMRVDEAHAVSHRVKDAVRGEMPLVKEVLVHIEPFAG